MLMSPMSLITPIAIHTATTRIVPSEPTSISNGTRFVFCGVIASFLRDDRLHIVDGPQRCEHGGENAAGAFRDTGRRVLARRGADVRGQIGKASCSGTECPAV